MSDENEIQRKIAELNELVVHLYQQGKYERAIEVALQSRDLTRKHFGEDHPLFASSLNNLAVLYQSMGNYAEAEPLFKHALEIRRRALGEDHPDFAQSMNNLAALYQLMGNYAEAEPLFKHALEIWRRALGEDHPDFATSLNNLAALYQSMGNYAEAEPLFKHALEITRRALGEDHPSFATSLNSLAVLYESMGNYAEAEPLYKHALEIWRRALGEDHPLFATSLNNLAALYKSMGNYAEAEPLYKHALEIRRRALGEDHPLFATSLNNLAALYQSMGNYAEAEPLYKHALEIRRRALGEDHPDFATSLNNLAALYQSMGNYAEAEPLYKHALEIRRRALGEDHPDFATSLNNLAAVYLLMGNYAEAEPLYKHALEITRRALGEDHPDFATSLNSLALLYQSMGNYAEAEPLYKHALEIRRRALGEDHPDFASSLNSLALLYQSMGNYAEAEPLYKHALEIRRRALGEDHPNFATSLNNLAALYQLMGNYAEAEPLYKHALEIWRRALGEDHPDFATSLNNLAALYQLMGNYAEAEPLYKHALEIARRALGEDHPDFATSLNNLAALYKSMGNYAEAEPLYKHALEITRRALGEDHPDFATSLNNLAALYKSMGNYAEAEPLYKHALEIARRALGEDHPLFATSLNNLALLYESMGNYAEAEPLYKHALEIARRALGEDHPDFATSLNNLALLYAATDHEREAYELMQRAQAIDDHMIGQVLSIGSETQRMAYLSMVRVHEERYMSLILHYFSTSSSAVQTALDLVLRRKALGAEAFATQRDAVLGGKYPELRNQLKKLSSLRMQIALKTLAGPGPEGIQAHLELMAEWKAQKEHLESELARQIPEMNLEQQVRAADRRAVSSSMPPGSTLIEFVRFDVLNFKAVPARNESVWMPAHYLAFTMPAGEPESVEMIDLGEAEPIDRLIAEFRATITGEDEPRAADRATTTIGWGRNGLPDATSKSSGLLTRLFKSHKRPVSESEEKERDLGAVAIEPASDPDNRIGNSLRSSLFDPLLAAIGECTHLLIAPDSNLSMLPFEVLPTEIGKRLIDQYYISYLSVGRDILRFHAESSGQPASPLVVADPAFDLSTSKKGVQAEMFLSKSRQSRDLDRSNIYFSPLPGTRREGEELAKMLGIQPWLDSKALEGKLKATTSPQILHIATHGFFLKDQERDLNKEMRDLGTVDWASGSDMGRLSGAGMENPLLRSGIALAGVNTWLKHGSLPPEAEDGILTAEDVSGLDLLATDLVVLSACETGLGKIHVGEGVFGLRRAFMLAGAKTLVMSLWKVPDQQTQELMVDFYRRIMSGQARAEALREAQLAMKAKYPDPKYWGGFICQGNPGPIRLGVK